MMSDALNKTARELMRKSQNGTHPISLLAERLATLLRIAAIQSDDPKSDIQQLQYELEPFIPEVYVLDGIASHILSIINGEQVAHDPIERSLDSFVDSVREAETELGEQISSLFNPGDEVIILGEREGGFIEAGLKDAAEGLVEEDPSAELTVTVIAALPDHEKLAERMSKRLGAVNGLNVKLLHDALVTTALRRCSKVILSALAIDMDSGGLCYRGSAFICSAAQRLKVPVVLAVPRHRILPHGSCALSKMSRVRTSPGKIWEYRHAREDRHHEAISIVAPAYDIIPHQRCEMFVTEFGGYATAYVKTFAPYPGSEGNEEEGEIGEVEEAEGDEGEGDGDGEEEGEVGGAGKGDGAGDEEGEPE